MPARRPLAYAAPVTSAGIGLSTGISPRAAARQAVEAAIAAAGSEPIDAALLFATTAWGPQLQEVLKEAQDAIGVGTVAGASVAGVFSEGAGTTNNPGIAVLALSGPEAEVVALDQLVGTERGAAADLLEHFSAPPGPDDFVLFLADSVGLVPAATFAGVGECLGSSTSFGLAASALPGGGALVWGGGEPLEAALACLVLRGIGKPHWGVARAGRTVTEPMTVTRSRDHWVKSLADRSATEVLEEVARTCGITDSREARRHLVVSIEPGPCDAGSEQPRDDWRDIVGWNPRQGSFALPLEVPVGSTLTFVLKDEVSARENLATLVRDHSDVNPLFGLYLEPETGIRPSAGGPAASAQCLADGFPDSSVLGLQGAFSILPTASNGAGCQTLHYSSLLALIEG